MQYSIQTFRLGANTGQLVSEVEFQLTPRVISVLWNPYECIPPL
jgi:hypothetical protein